MDGIKLHFKTISDSLNTIYINDCKVEFLESEIEIHGTDEAQKLRALKALNMYSIYVDIEEVPETTLSCIDDCVDCLIADELRRGLSKCIFRDAIKTHNRQAFEHEYLNISWDALNECNLYED
jgi:hypothetical protein